MSRRLNLQHVISFLLSMTLGALASFNVQAEENKTANHDPDLSDYRQFVSYPHVEKGLKAFSTGNQALAVKELGQAHQLAPDSRRIGLQYALVLASNGQATEAMDVLHRWIEAGTATPEMQSAYRQMWLSQNKEYLRRLRNAKQESEFRQIQSNIDKSFDSAYDESIYVETLAASPYIPDRELIAYTPRFTENLQVMIAARLESKSNTKSANEFVVQVAPLLNGRGELLNQVTFVLSTRRLDKTATTLLLQTYPYRNFPPETRTSLLGRLSALAVKHPELISSNQTTQLCQPLSSADERSVQIELLKDLNACDCLRINFMPYVANMKQRDLANMSQCYSQQPGLAEYTAAKSIGAHPTASQFKLLAYSAYKTEDYETSLKAWRKIPNDQWTPKDRLAAQTTAIATGDIAYAREQGVAYEKTGEAPDDRYYWNRALIAIDDEAWQSAANDLQAAIKIKPEASYYNKLAIVEDHLGHPDLAMANLKKAVALAPEDSQTLSDAGFLAYRTGDYELANKSLTEALRGRPDDIGTIEQLAYANQKQGQNTQAIYFSKLAIDDYQRRSSAETSDRDRNTEFGLRRMNEDLERRWSFNIDGAMSNNETPLTGSPQPGLSYRNYWQAEAAYRLGDMGVDNGKTYSAYSRIFSGNGFNSNVLPLNAPMLGVGLRWKPFSEHVINLAAEEQIPLDNVQGTRTDTLVRASGSFFNSGRFSDDWHPTGSGWMAQNLYLDGAYYLGASTSTLTADYRSSYHFKLTNGKTLEPYAHLQWNTMNTVTGDDFRIGIGVRWNLWRNEEKYSAYSSRYFLGVEGQHAFTTYLNAKNAILAVLGVRL